MRNVKWLLILLYFISVTVCAHSQFEWKMTLHFSGKQRMLTQKMSKEILFIAQNINVEENKRNLYKSARLFSFTLKGLLNGEKKLHLVKSINPSIIQQLNIVTKLWEQFHKNIELVLAANMSITLLKDVANQNMPLLLAMDKAVKLYEQDSSFTLEASRARVLNLSGRQRMLTQKITKELLLVINGIAPKENKALLQKTMHQFERILMGLLNGDAELGLKGTKHFALRNQLRAVKYTWNRYKRLLNKRTLSKKDLMKIAKINMRLLKEMNNAMKISFGKEQMRNGS